LNWTEVVVFVAFPWTDVERGWRSFGADKESLLELWAWGDRVLPGVGDALGEEEGFDVDVLQDSFDEFGW
jgi:hypothetical protein